MKQLSLPRKWATLIDEWRRSLKAAGLTDQTIETRSEHLRRLARTSQTTSPARLTKPKLEAWAGDQEWQAETRRSVYASIRSFYQWAQRAHGIDDVSSVLPRVKPGKPLPRPVDEMTYRQALADASGNQRAHLILRLAGEAGLRRAEIAKIQQGDLITDLLGISLLVHGKGAKPRVVPLTDSLARELTDYLGKRRILFPNDATGEPLTPRHVGKIAARFLPAGCGLHRLRHRFSAIVYRQTKDLRALQTLLGHASLATTERYVPIPQDALRQVVSAAA